MKTSLTVTSPVRYESGRHRAEVNFDDLIRLDEGEYLNDTLIEFYMMYVNLIIPQSITNLDSSDICMKHTIFRRTKSTSSTPTFTISSLNLSVARKAVSITQVLPAGQQRWIYSTMTILWFLCANRKLSF